MTTHKPRSRGRPRAFDIDEAVARAQRLFHERGYDAVSVADLTEALGINPPSFYAAFGSKRELYERVLDRYAQTGAIPIAELLRADRPVAASLSALLEEAARRYAADPAAAGCLVIEGTRCSDPAAREGSRAFHLAAQDAISGYIAARHPEEADRLTDFVSTAMAGLSAMARNGHTLGQLLGSARLAGFAITGTLSGRGPEIPSGRVHD